MLVRIVIVSMLVLLAACGVPEPAAPSVSAPTQEGMMETDTPPATNPTAPTETALPADSSSLAGTEWTLESFGPDDAPLQPLADTTISIAFTDTQVSGSFGCNSFFGGYTVDGQQITFSQLAQTLMACEDQINQQENQLSKALQSVQTFTINGDTLRLNYAEGTLRYTRKQPEPDKALEGTPWQLDSFVSNDAARSLFAGTQITATFADGRVTGSAGCNNYSGSYTLNDGKISVGNDIVSTRKACQPDVMQQEQEFLQALAATTSYAIDGAQLTLSQPGGQLVFKAE